MYANRHSCHTPMSLPFTQPLSVLCPFFVRSTYRFCRINLNYATTLFLDNCISSPFLHPLFLLLFKLYCSCELLRLILVFEGWRRIHLFYFIRVELMLMDFKVTSNHASFNDMILLIRLYRISYHTCLYYVVRASACIQTRPPPLLTTAVLVPKTQSQLKIKNLNQFFRLTGVSY